MKIINLTAEHESLYHICLEDWSDEIKEAGNHKQKWCLAMKDKGLRVKLALDDDGQVGGMIQYLPVEHSFLDGRDSYFIPCIWVHGHKKGRGNFQKHGLGKALLEAAESDVRELGGKAIVAWGISLPFWLKAGWFKKQGYKKIDKMGLQVLLWKPFSTAAVPPKWIRKKKKPSQIPGKVAVTAFINGWCPAQNMVFERVKRAVLQFGDKVVFQEIQTTNRETMLEWGLTDAIFIDGKQLGFGPPLSFEKIQRKIGKRVKKL